jgi:hypothetical protein
MLDWISPLVFFQTIIRVAVVWVAFYGAGHFVEKFFHIRKLFPLLPKEISGALFLILLEIPLSLFGIMNRTVTPILILLFSVPGMLLLVRKLRTREKAGKAPVLQIIGIIALLAVAFLSLTYASMPNLTFDDPLITYAVQPDRWLNSGRVYWLQDEMLAVWPASLSSDRLDQLSMLQVFQMTLLFLALFRGMQLMDIKKKFRATLAFIVLICSMMYYWCSLAKTDTAAILFCTLALASVIREMSERTIKPYSSWLFMGLALATKQTSILVFFPFLLYGGFRLWKESWGVKLTALACLALIPGIFGIRTMLKTGSPSYPVYQIPFMVKDDWKLIAEPEEITMINNRDSELYENRNFSLLKHIGIFLTSMEGILLLLLGGLGVSLFQKNRNWMLFLPLFAYFAVAIVVMWPPWWGAKYSILIYPFVALMGVRALQTRELFSSFYLPGVCIVSFIVPGFIAVPTLVFPASYRYTVAKSVIQGDWDMQFGYKVYPSTPEGEMQMWLNSFITEPSIILSIHEEKRYFCDHTIYVGWRHPATQGLYLDNTLEEECAILDELGIDYVTFYRSDPCIMEMENRLAILNHIGYDDILEPLITGSNGFLVCRYNSPN